MTLSLSFFNFYFKLRTSVAFKWPIRLSGSCLLNLRILLSRINEAMTFKCSRACIGFVWDQKQISSLSVECSGSCPFKESWCRRSGIQTLNPL